MKIVLAGAVSSTHATLNKLIEHKMDVLAVLGYSPKDNTSVSGYVDLSIVCQQNKITYKPFTKINSPDIVKYLKKLAPDILFVVGLSQLVSKEILTLPKLGCIGFHPTRLPTGRGRAPIAWLVLEGQTGAANFFLMNDGVDSGPVFVQRKFEIDPSDDAASVEGKVIEAIKQSLDVWLPDLKQGIWNPIPQDDSNASYYEKRCPEDGWIDWTLENNCIDRLIKASAKPHPMAYSFYKGRKVFINKSCLEFDIPIKGVVGRIVRIRDKGEGLIQCGTGLIWINEVCYADGSPVLLSVGQKFGYYSELEIYNLYQRIHELEQKVK